MEPEQPQSKALLIGIILIIIVVGGGLLLLKNRPPVRPEVSNEEQVTEIPQTTVSPTTLTPSPKVTSTTVPSQKKETPTPTPQVTKKETALKITLSPNKDSKSAQKGTATLTEVNGKVRVVLALTGGDYAKPQPAHIHASVCPKPDKVIYPLKDAIDGKSDTTIDTTLADLLKKKPLAINIHKSKDESTVYTACGDIKD